VLRDVLGRLELAVRQLGILVEMAPVLDDGRLDLRGERVDLLAERGLRGGGRGPFSP
jgi:hypothetical protein